MRTIWLAASIYAIAAATCLPVSSQAQTGPQNSDGASAPEQGGIADIVVTAQRREENLQRAAVPVSAVTGEALASAGISDTANLSRLVPSLQIQPSGGTQSQFYLRGVGTL